MLHRTPSSQSLRTPSGRVRAARFGRAKRVAAAATTIAASAAALIGIAGQEATHAAVSGPTAAYMTATIADTNFPIPTGALYVANGGADTNPGTLAAPLATIKKA